MREDTYGDQEYWKAQYREFLIGQDEDFEIDRQKIMEASFNCVGITTNKAEETQMKTLKFKYMNGQEYTVKKVVNWDMEATLNFSGTRGKVDWVCISYTQKPDKFTTTNKVIPAYDLLSLTIFDGNDVTVKTNPKFDTVVDVEVQTKRQKIRKNNLKGKVEKELPTEDEWRQAHSGFEDITSYIR